jgi:hypothetical protein
VRGSDFSTLTLEGYRKIADPALQLAGSRAARGGPPRFAHRKRVLS